jgi:hypothetical protein
VPGPALSGSTRTGWALEGAAGTGSGIPLIVTPVPGGRGGVGTNGVPGTAGATAGGDVMSFVQVLLSVEVQASFVVEAEI